MDGQSDWGHNEKYLEPLHPKNLRLTTKEITAACETETTDLNARRRARKRLRATKVKLWQESQPRREPLSAQSTNILADPRDHSRVRADADPDLAAEDRVGKCKSLPVRYMFTCPNQAHGCTWTTWCLDALGQHYRKCTALLPSPAKLHPCSRDGCPKTFTSRSTMLGHVRTEHDYTPRTCDGSGPVCINRVFDTNGKYQAHRKKHHPRLTSSWSAQTCLIPDCSSKRVFATLDRYKVHLDRVHKIDSKHWDNYVPESCRQSCRNATKERLRTLTKGSVQRYHVMKKMIDEFVGIQAGSYNMYVKHSKYK